MLAKETGDSWVRKSPYDQACPQVLRLILDRPEAKYIGNYSLFVLTFFYAFCIRMDNASMEVKKKSDDRSEVSSNILLYLFFYRPSCCFFVTS